MRKIDDILGPVLDSNFEIVTTDILKIYVLDEKAGADKVLSVDLSDLMKK